MHAMHDVVTGYYRYTDVWYEWHQALPNPDDRVPLKAMLAHDSLTHSKHPLRKEGIDGIEMWIGTLASGERRLLFSSAQVDYIRYWLHAMQLTKEIIPLPYSDCLVMASSLRSVSPVIYKNGGALRKAVKDISKNNKRLKGASDSLNARRDMFERIRALWAAKVGVWCAIDFEAWDRDHALLTEVGWSLVDWQDGIATEENVHLIVAERRGYKSTYVDQWRDNYNFGKSEDVNKTTFAKRIHALFARLRKTNGPVFLVFHSHRDDIRYLNSKGVQAPIQDISYSLPDSPSKTGLFVVDTAEMFAALEGESNRNMRSLKTVCNHLQIQASFLHNAGNDAYYTLSAMKSMASGDPLDTQRESRWPSKTEGVKVQFTTRDEENDDELDDVMPPVAGYDPITGQLINSAADEGEN